MTFNVYKPSRQLEPFIVCYMEADSRTINLKRVHTLFPNGYSGVFFNFGYAGEILIKEEIKTPHVSIFGQIDQCFEAIHWPGSYSLGALMHPTAHHPNQSLHPAKPLQQELLHFAFNPLHFQRQQDLQHIHGRQAKPRSKSLPRKPATLRLP